MDHAHPWRSRSPIPPSPAAPPSADSLCPVCSIPHFPFCLPPYPPNPRLPFPDQFYPHPPPPPTRYQPPQPPPPQHQPPPPPPPPQTPYDPFTDHQTGPMPPPPRPWNTNPSFDRDQPECLNPIFNYPHAGFKRPRVDGPGSGQCFVSNANNNNYAVSADDERRLKLIREHGGQNPEFDKKIVEFQECRNGFESNSMNISDMSNFRDRKYSNFDWKEMVYCQESNYNTPCRQYMHKNSNAEPGNSRYDQGEGRFYQSNGYGYIGHQADGYGNADTDHVTSERKGCGSISRAGNYEIPYMNNQGGCMNKGTIPCSRASNVHSPLPASPPPPLLPVERPGRPSLESAGSTSLPSSVFPVSIASSSPSVYLYPPVPEANSLASRYYPSKVHPSASSGFPSEDIQNVQQFSSKTYLGHSDRFPLGHLSSNKPKTINASHLLKHPHRATRPDHFVIILRGLPGSGKSYLAKLLRDLEVENGGTAPRIHTMDDYFMTEVEKVEESESKPSGLVRGRKPVTKKVMEYCYEPEMEEAYRSSMLKSFKKTLDEGVFSFVIVDDRNLRVADFAQFWATAKRSGYEVYLLEATYKDPAGCAARNIHGFTQEDIQKMADQWEDSPSLYLKLESKSLLHGDNLDESGIQEVDMDAEDGDPIGTLPGLDERNPERSGAPPPEHFVFNGDKRRNIEPDHQIEEVKELGKSKWSNDLHEDDVQNTKADSVNLNVLSGLVPSYNKEGKTVHWGDQVGNSGFSIGAAKSAHTSSLVIGPGAGYNLKTNPLAEEDKMTLRQSSGEPKRQNVFQDQLRAERESFKAVFDKRRHRIGGLHPNEE